MPKKGNVSHATTHLYNNTLMLAGCSLSPTVLGAPVLAADRNHRRDNLHAVLFGHAILSLVGSVEFPKFRRGS